MVSITHQHKIALTIAHKESTMEPHYNSEHYWNGLKWPDLRSRPHLGGYNLMYLSM